MVLYLKSYFIVQTEAGTKILIREGAGREGVGEGT